MSFKKYLLNIAMVILISYTLNINFIFSQTTVTPVLTLNGAGFEDQDDMCIWVHPTDKSLSTIITSDKSAEMLFVYSLDGSLLQSIDVGYPGNVDIRYNFLLSGAPTDIVGFNSRSANTLVFYKVNPATRQLSPAGSFSSGSNYGFCLYHSPVDQKFYAFSSSESSNIRQYEIEDSNNDGLIEGTLVRQMSNGSNETEGMVADDETGILYAANENAGIYKYNAEPSGGTNGVLVAGVGSNGLTADVEGISIYYKSQGEGYLITSSQGSNNFKVYERKEPHNFVKTVQVTGVGSTDGIDVTNVNLGPLFPTGIFLVHDGTGSPYVIRGCHWEDLGLEVDTTYWNPTPVELNSFDVDIINGKAELNWRTSSEINNYGFEIERSEAGNNFIKIGFMPGHGTTTQIHTYQFTDNSSLFGSVAYRLKQIDLDGSTNFSSTIEVNFPSSIDFVLAQNYPNPFNPDTKIVLRLPFRTQIQLSVYDALGKLVKVLATGEYQAGTHEFNFEASGLPSGIYFYKVESPEFSEVKKMIYLK